MMSVPLTSNTGTRRVLHHEGNDLIKVVEYNLDEIVAYYEVFGNVLEKWSKDPERRSWIEFASPISLRYTVYGDLYTVNACVKGGVLAPNVVNSLESREGILRHFRIGHDMISDWFRRIA